MDHAVAKEQLYALYDGELDAAVSQSVKAHLDGCLECREIYERWSRTAKVLFRVAKPETSEFFVRQVMRRIRELEPPRRTFGWDLSLPWLVPALGLVLMILVVTPPQSASTEEFIFSNTAVSAYETLQYLMEG